MEMSRFLYEVWFFLARARSVRVIHNESGDPNGGNMCSFSGATCTSRVRHNADYVPYAKIRFDL